MSKFNRFLLALRLVSKRFFFSLFTLNSFLLLIIWVVVELAIILIFWLRFNRTLAISFEFAQIISIIWFTFLLIHSNPNFSLQRRVFDAHKNFYRNIKHSLKSDNPLTWEQQQQFLEKDLSLARQSKQPRAKTSLFQNTKPMQVVILLLALILLLFTTLFY